MGHQDILESSVPTLISWALSKRMGISKCPLCPSSGPQDAPDLVDHVLTCVHNFSLYALPWARPDIHDLEKPVGIYSLPDNKEEAESLSLWIDSVKPETGAHEWFQLSYEFDIATHSGGVIGDIPDDVYHIDDVDYFAQEDGDASAEPQTGLSITSSPLAKAKHSMSNYNKDYTVGWICSLEVEYAVARAFLDEIHPEPERVSHYANVFTLGKIAELNIVIFMLPESWYLQSPGDGIFTEMVFSQRWYFHRDGIFTEMVHCFPNIMIALIVGIASGSPSQTNDIRLGDIVVSIASNGKPGILRYESATEVQGDLRRKWREIPKNFLKALRELQIKDTTEVDTFIKNTLENSPGLQKSYIRPKLSTDQLYESEYIHPESNKKCAAVCDSSYLISRRERGGKQETPVVHYGLVVSGRREITNALIRDEISTNHDVLCFELGVDGNSGPFPCLHIRGICDYADSHKNTEWLGFAAVAAGGYAKALLCQISPYENEAEELVINQEARENDIFDGELLKRRLREKRVLVNRQQQQFFIPRSDINDIITRPVIKDIIQRGRSDLLGDKNTVLEYAAAAENKARCVFATLVWLERGADICSFLDEGVDDTVLPLECCEQSGKILLRTRAKKYIKACEKWEVPLSDNFERWQWCMTAPVFQFNGDCQEFSPQTVLPLDEVGKPRIHEGRGFTVHLIHPAHHNFWKTTNPTDKQPLVAIKSFPMPDEISTADGKILLNKLTSSDHPHLIRLLTSYYMEHKFHLIFQRPSSNLRSFWDSRCPSPEFNQQTICWSLKQMKGLAMGLSLMHTLSIPVRKREKSRTRLPNNGGDLEFITGKDTFQWRGYLSPNDILWFQQSLQSDKNDEMGILQIPVNFDYKDLSDPKGSLEIASTYQAPETELGPASDIWVLGCVYLEFLTWLLKGASEIDTFSDFRGKKDLSSFISDDCFFSLFLSRGKEKKHPELREEVVDWVDELHCHSKCSQAIHNILDLVMDQCLKVKCEDRITASDLGGKLEDIQTKATNDNKYLLEPVPYALPPRDKEIRSKNNLGNMHGAITTITNCRTVARTAHEDLVCQFVGCTMPVILRHYETEGFKFVRERYVYGKSAEEMMGVLKAAMKK